MIIIITFLNMQNMIKDESVKYVRNEVVKVGYVSSKMALAKNNKLGVVIYEEGLKRGDIVKISGKLTKLNKNLNPFGFNEEIYLKIRGIKHKLYGKVEIVKSAANNINIYSKKEDIIRAMLLGDKSKLTKETKELYSNIGISHMIVVSGLHMGIIAYIFGKMIKEKYLIVILFAYILFIGINVSSLRAFIMISMYILSRELGRDTDSIQVYFASMLSIIIINPLYIYDNGFVLSYTAVGSLIFITPIFNKMYFLKEKIRRILSPMLAIFIGMLPINMYYFYNINLIGFILNFIVIPTVPIVMISSIIGILFGYINREISELIMRVPEVFIDIYEVVGKKLLECEFFKIETGSQDVYKIFIYYTIIFIIYLVVVKKIKKLIMVIPIFLFLLFFKGYNIRIDAPYIGQGDCFVVTADEETMIIDGGNKGKGKVIYDYLNYRGIKEIRYLLVTHKDSDHIKGLLELLEYRDIKVKAIISFEENDLTNKGRGLNIEIIFVEKGDVIKLGNIEAKVIHPYREYKAKNENGNSLVLLFDDDKFRGIFTGDIEKNEEVEILKEIEKEIKLDYFKVSHHGSKTSTIESFLDKFKSNKYFISAGLNNKYGHPHKEVMRRLDGEVFVTSINGMIEYKK
ncbi:MAG: DNA internalization-related competence protein ComEC/Rec2 [Clostridia bacterium]|nr:DNA internalization-related competence protein ComEC/Rec2 [Clostridia bacterium]